jgi:D-alanyl-D-alanine dipeptidase
MNGDIRWKRRVEKCKLNFLHLKVIRLSLILFVPFLFFSCEEKQSGIVHVQDKPVFDTTSRIEKKKVDTVALTDSIQSKKSALEMELDSLGLVNVQSLDSTILTDLKYSTPLNFIGVDVYGDFDQCYLQEDVAGKLVNAQKYLREKYPYYSLVVFDAVRPLSIQQKMWDTLALPPGEKIKYLSNPKHFSLHNYGAAVDLSIADQNGILLDMGTPFDFFGEKAHPVKEQELLATGELTQHEISNREILRSVMRKAGFFGIQTEWWHFNSCTREVAATKYQIVP